MNIISKKSQSGAALILSLLMLLVLSLLAISGMQGTVMQERMVSAEREGLVSLEIAESGLRDAEAFLETINSLGEFDGTDGLYGVSDATPDPLVAATWNGNVSRTANTVNGVTPRFFVKHVGEALQQEKLTDIVVQNYSHETGAATAQAFRVIAWSPGATGQSQRIIESYYAREL